ncbi:methyl-CpG-binding domain protein 2 isoform X2 [Culicoides brevitarsis]|uniref:methyl-CpG-binding domain protein 2 isoform X2 n=1 Tax=Culicoides brevitarsis TaxID=469753 RepID=UPI00307C451A
MNLGKRMDARLLQQIPPQTEIRKTGQTAGSADIYYYSRGSNNSNNSKYDTAKISMSRIGDGTVDLTGYDYSLSSANKLIQNINPNISLHSTTLTSVKRKEPPVAYSGSPKQQATIDYSRPPKPDASLVPPIRQTASIFKQPVTLYKTNTESIVKGDLKPTTNDKPKQLFWEKRLEKLSACASDGEEFKQIDLEGCLKPVGPFISEMTVLQSVATALHLNNGPITGQTASKASLLSNAGAFTNPDQPLMHAVNITDDDIRRQEEKVNNARKLLQEALKA